MCVVMQSEINRLHGMKLLDRLLLDKTSGGNIIWATDAYNAFGDDYRRDKEITIELLMREPFKLMSRAEKARDAQSERTKAHAEVFTPFWVVKKMNDHMEAEWFGYENPFNAERVIFPEGKTWKQFVDSRRMEITCGEGPYLVTRYDVASGDEISLRDRVGILDRKLRVVSENATDDEWLEWAYRAVESTYGYEFQGDNVLLARLNLFLTFEEYMQERMGRKPDMNECKKLTNILAWNIWQMDGLSGTIPYCKAEEEFQQMTLFDLFGSETNDTLENRVENTQPPCRIFDWRAKCGVEYRKLREATR